jgi:hypothetical protein
MCGCLWIALLSVPSSCRDFSTFLLITTKAFFEEWSLVLAKYEYSDQIRRMRRVERMRGTHMREEEWMQDSDRKILGNTWVWIY